jgi:hypothetical protein
MKQVLVSARRSKPAMSRNLLTLMLAMMGAAATASAQETNSAVPAYCPDLQRVVALAMTNERFAPISGQPREGNFLDTSLPLTGWKNCSLYGRATYTCDSNEFKTSEEATQAQAAAIAQIKSCLGETWAEAEERSSPGYRVLHTTAVPVSITLSTDETDRKGHVVRIIIFVRGSQAR